MPRDTHPEQTVTESTIREYAAQARTTDIFGRVLCSVRDHHYIIDGPKHNQCPGEEVTPGEMFLSTVTACGVELLQVIAKEEGMPLRRVVARIEAIVDRERQTPGVTLFNKVRIWFTTEGVTQPQAQDLVGRFKARCPLYGTVSTAISDVAVEVTAQP
jgi:uncharacterized OsmC-like protein